MKISFFAVLSLMGFVSLHASGYFESVQDKHHNGEVVQEYLLMKDRATAGSCVLKHYPDRQFGSLLNVYFPSQGRFSDVRVVPSFREDPNHFLNMSQSEAKSYHSDLAYETRNSSALSRSGFGFNEMEFTYYNEIVGIKYFISSEGWGVFTTRSSCGLVGGCEFENGAFSYRYLETVRYCIYWLNVKG